MSHRRKRLEREMEAYIEEVISWDWGEFARCQQCERCRGN